jgi:RNA polymerase sigma-70 factor (ECF subfamily)
MPETEDILSVYLSIRASLARAVMAIVPPREIEDIVQETYVRVCQIEKKERIAEPRSFLFRTARNLALDYVKKAETRLTGGVDDIDSFTPATSDALTDDTLGNVTSNEEFALFCESVRMLPVKCRRAFVLKKVYGYTQREIAREMMISEKTVEKHISAGIKRCTYFMMQQRGSTDNSSAAGSGGTLGGTAAGQGDGS